MRKKLMNYLSAFMLLLFGLTLANNIALAQTGVPCAEGEDYLVFCDMKKKWFVQACKYKPGWICKMDGENIPDLPDIE